MSASAIVAPVFLAVACAGVSVQAFSLVRLRRAPAAAHDTCTLATRGLVRTHRCRVTVGGLYVAIGANAVFIGVDVAAVALAGFSVTQMIWLTNSVLDVRLARALKEAAL